MLMLDIIATLRERVPLLAHRVGGTASIEDLSEVAKLAVPAAYVIPMDEKPGEQQDQAGYEQTVEVSFAVVVVLDNSSDELGFAAMVQQDQIKRQIFAALLGWDPPEHEAIEYTGGSLVDLTRARLVYQFEFNSAYVISKSNTWLEQRDEALPSFGRFQGGLDCIEPFDRNLALQGPDGRLESQFQISLP